MRFSDTSTKTGMLQMCEDLLGYNNGQITDSSNLKQRFTRLINDRYNQVSNKIWKMVGDWEFDDTNQTTLPIATADLVANQQDYELPSSAQKLERVEVKNQDGDYVVIDPIDKSQIPDIALTEYYEDSGMPLCYDVVGRSLVLYPAPGTGYVTLTDGLKVYVSRDVIQFNATATTQEPGFAKQFHRILPVGACMDFAVGSQMFNSVNSLNILLKEVETDMNEFYARRHRNPDSNPRIRPNDEGMY